MDTEWQLYLIRKARNLYGLGFLYGGGGGILSLRSPSTALHVLPLVASVPQAKPFRLWLARSTHKTVASHPHLCIKKEPFGSLKIWRRRWDSNPRNACTFDSFQDCSDQPLWHSSKTNVVCYWNYIT